MTPEVPTSLAAAVGAAMNKSAEAPAPEVVEPVAPVVEEKPVAPVKEAPKAKADPLAELETPEDDDSGFKLPIDEDDTEDEPEEAPTKDNAAGRRIEALKAEIKETWKPQIAAKEQEIAQLKTQILEAKAAADELEELRSLKTTYESEMSITKLEKTPVFIKEVTEPFADIEAKATVLAEQYSIPTKDLFAAFAIADDSERKAALKAVTSGLEIDPDDAFELRTLAAQVQPIYKRQDELFANADKALLELSAKAEQETAAQAATRAAERGKAVDVVAKRLMASMPGFKDVFEKVSEATKDVDFDSQEVAMKAYNHMAGAALPKLKTLNAKLQSQLDQALDDIEAYKKASGRVVGSFSKSDTTAAPKSLAEAVERGLQKA